MSGVYDYLFKYIIVGDSSVGKSCLLGKFTTNNFNMLHDMTIGVEFGAKIIETRDRKFKLQIWDTAGQESFRSVTRSYYRGAAGVMLCFDVTNYDSFANVQKWINEIYDNCPQTAKILLVGTKTDLGATRAVKYDDAKKFADENKFQYIEVSSKLHKNVSESFIMLAETIYDDIVFKSSLNDSGVGSPLKVPLGENKKIPEEKSKCCGQ